MILLAIVLGACLEPAVAAEPATAPVKPQAAAAKPPAAAAVKPLVVATNRVPPFVITNISGDKPAAAEKPVGLTISLVEAIGKALGRPVKWVPMEFPQVMEAVKAGTVDMAAGAISVTAEREKLMDFSHPFISTGLGIAVRSSQKNSLWSMMDAIASRSFLEVIGSLAVLIAVVGAVIWLLERRGNPAQFGGTAAHGIGSGFWWSAVTMSTVGYGDKTPHSLAGRVLGIVWMFASIIIISSFTAAVSAVMTVNRLEGDVLGPRDLHNVRVATVASTAAARWLDDHQIRFATYANLTATIEALAKGETDAIVYDAPLLTYLSAQRPKQDIKILDAIFSRQNYAIALPAGSPLRKPINEALLATMDTPAWQDEMNHWLPEH
ncbi:MAG: transporter substrate-binding domain-containing protein [Rhodospirillaceae bacterium]